MNELQIFNYEGNQVRTVQRGGEPWWVLKDVCAVLGIEKYRDTATRLDDDEREPVVVDTLGGPQEMTAVNESGLYNVILLSRKPEAKKFKRWVTHEVLPSIRKTGMYATVETAERLMNDPDFLIRALEEIKAVRTKNAALKAENAAMRPKARFADAVACAETDIPVGELAKILRGNGVDIGQTRLFEWMRANEYLMQRMGAGWNAPTQRAMELGLFRVTETTTTRADGRVDLNRVTMVTGKGQLHFVNHFLDKA
ncbi:MAG: phage antirepressor [Oscillospiraceae bacterium]|nr:phage antirepressor [Oscillospiraceae bacterium]